MLERAYRLGDILWAYVVTPLLILLVILTIWSRIVGAPPMPAHAQPVIVNDWGELIVPCDGDLDCYRRNPTVAEWFED